MTTSAMPGAPAVNGPRVAYQGEPGAYGEMAIVRQWSGTASAMGAPTFADTIGLLASGDADLAVIPVWNSTIGDLQDTNLLLAHHVARIDTVGEVSVPIEHCLLALPGASFATVRYVGSQAAALAQCRRLFVTRPALQPCVAHDTAGAARQLAALGGTVSEDSAQPRTPAWYEPYRRATSPTALAVIAGAQAARAYGLVVLAERVQDEPANTTRFVVLKAKEGARW